MARFPYGHSICYLPKKPLPNKFYPENDKWQMHAMPSWTWNVYIHTHQQWEFSIHYLGVHYIFSSLYFGAILMRQLKMNNRNIFFQFVKKMFDRLNFKKECNLKNKWWCYNKLRTNYNSQSEEYVKIEDNSNISYSRMERQILENRCIEKKREQKWMFRLIVDTCSYTTKYYKILQSTTKYYKVLQSVKYILQTINA